MNDTPRNVGRITAAAGLVAIGAGLLMDSLLGAGPRFARLILRFWPVLLIGFGLEYLLSSLLERADAAGRRRLRFDLGGAFLLAAVLGLVAAANAFSAWISLDPQDYVLLGSGAGHTEVRSAPAAGAKALTVNVDVGRVALYSHSQDEVRVEAEYGLQGVLLLRDQARAVEQFSLDVQEGETITVTGRAPDGINLGGLTATYRIYAPEGLQVTVDSGAGSIAVRDYGGDLHLTTRVGSITVEAGSGSVAANTSSGTIQVDAFTGPVQAATNTGSIRVDRVTGSLSLRSGTGVINVEDYAGGGLSAETRTGSIHVDTSAPPEGPIVLRTATGAITLALPEQSDVRLEASTKAGSISGAGAVSGQGPSRSAALSLGAGTHPVTLEANMGSIHIQTH